MKAISIRIADEGEQFPGAFVVEQDGKHHDGLGWDEMLGQVVSLTFDNVKDRIARWGGNGLYPMKSSAEWEEERNRRLGAAEQTIEPAAFPEVDTVGAAAERSRAQGYTGDACSTCGQFRMKQAGHCLVCDECGTTTGCS